MKPKQFDSKALIFLSTLMLCSAIFIYGQEKETHTVQSPDQTIVLTVTLNGFCSFKEGER